METILKRFFEVILFLLLTTTSHRGFGEAFYLKRNSQHILRHNDPQRILEICRNLSALAAKLESSIVYGIHSSGNTTPESSCPTPSGFLATHQKNEEGYYEFDISEILPEALKNVSGECTFVDGPNCFNATLVSTGLLPYFRNSEDKELQSWLESPLCRVNPPGPSHAGDISVIYARPVDGRDWNQNPEHAFTFIDTEFSFTKNGMKKEKAYTFESSQSILESYNVIPSEKGLAESFSEAQKNDPDLCVGLNPNHSEQRSLLDNCQYFSVNYRCQTLSDYVESVGKEEEFNRCYAGHQAFEKMISDSQMAGIAVNPSDSGNAQLTLGVANRQEALEAYELKRAFERAQFNAEQSGNTPATWNEFSASSTPNCRRYVEDFRTLENLVKNLELQNLGQETQDRFLDERFFRPALVHAPEPRFPSDAYYRQHKRVEGSHGNYYLRPGQTRFTNPVHLPEFEDYPADE